MVTNTYARQYKLSMSRLLHSNNIVYTLLLLPYYFLNPVALFHNGYVKHGADQTLSVRYLLKQPRKLFFLFKFVLSKTTEEIIILETDFIKLQLWKHHENITTAQLNFSAVMWKTGTKPQTYLQNVCFIQRPPLHALLRASGALTQTVYCH